MIGREQFVVEYDVPRGTLEQLDRFVGCVVGAHTRMNLVATSTLPDMWTRHIADSAQLAGLGDLSSPWLDLGSGAGFPGIVLALFGAEVDMVESTMKKAKFLRETIDVLGIASRARVHGTRIEVLQSWPVTTIVARALAPLPTLFDYGLRFTSVGTRWILPKGKQVNAEIAAARARFDFDHELVRSRTSSDGQIVVARSVKPQR